MKRLLLLPILILKITVACDQPHEEIANIRIGCPFEDQEGYIKETILEETDESGEIIASIYHYVDSRDPDLFVSDRNHIITINNIIEYAEINNIVDPQDIIEDFDSKWDNQIKTNECEIWGMLRESERHEEYCNSPERNIYVWFPSDDVLHKIILKYAIRSYQITAISELYQTISATMQEDKDKKAIFIQKTLEKHNIRLPLIN